MNIHNLQKNISQNNSCKTWLPVTLGLLGVGYLHRSEGRRETLAAVKRGEEVLVSAASEWEGVLGSLNK